MHRDRMMALGVYVVGLLATLVFIACKSEWAMECFAGSPERVGDLYDLARVAHFHEEMPPRVTTRSPWCVADADDATVLIFGDSFLDAAFGHGSFIDQLADTLQVPVWFGGRYPLQVLPRELEHLDRERIVLLESVDRFIDLDFNRAMPPESAPTAPAPPIWYSAALEIRLRCFRNTELNYRQFLRNCPLSRGLATGFANVRYRLLGEITDKTPVQNTDPPMLFFYQNVESGSFYKGRTYLHSDQDIATIANHLAQLDRRLRTHHRARLAFLGIPNKYVLYGDPESQYDHFLPRLNAALAARGTLRIDIYEPFRNHPTPLYWASDTHWNAQGVAIAVAETAAVLRLLLPPQ